MAGCASETSSEDAAPVDPAAGDGENELRDQSLKLGGGNALAVTDSPALKAGAVGTLACAAADRFAFDGRDRLTCKRGSEVLEVIVHKAEKTAVVIHRPTGRASTPTYFVCTTSGTSSDGLPANLACSKKAPTSASGHGGLASPFASTVDGVHIPNAHAVGTSGLVLRGMTPRADSDYAELKTAGVGAVLVFKNATAADDLPTEITALTGHGVPAANILDIPFKWKDIGGFTDPCKQTIQGLKFIAANIAAHKKTYFHCTVGEDRTGMLAAMHRLVTEPSLGADHAFDQEMCERGYAAGNPLKPAFVTSALDNATGLTPLYQKLAFLVAKGKIKASALDESVCNADPASDATFAATALPLTRLKCGTSTRFEP